MKSKVIYTSILLFIFVIGYMIQNASAEDTNTTKDVPKGTILAWYSKDDAPPTGWSYCDGTNGTPDLTKKYLLGTNDKLVIGQPFGSESHQHSFGGRTTNSENGTFWTYDDPKANQHPGASGLDHNHGFSGSTSGEGNYPPSIYVRYIMKIN